MALDAGGGGGGPGESLPDKLTTLEALQLADQVGFHGAGLVIAVAVAMAESSLRVRAVHDDPGGRGVPPSIDRGLWQINSVAHPDISEAEAFNPTDNARAALEISDHGTDWQPWTTYRDGAYKSHLAAVRSALASDQKLADAAGDEVWTVAATARWALAQQKAHHDIRYAELRPMHLVRPPEYPKVMDCSYFATWCYYVSGSPDPNGSDYDGSGYTGTLLTHGHYVPYPKAVAGDLVFYKNPDHVTVYIGHGRVISMGQEGDPIELDWSYRTVYEIHHYVQKARVAGVATSPSSDESQTTGGSSWQWAEIVKSAGAKLAAPHAKAVASLEGLRHLMY